MDIDRFLHVAQVGTVNLEDTDAKYVDLYQYAYSKYTNSLDFFTSADISQYTYVISLNSDCPVKDLYVDYDIPIEMANNNEHISVGTRGFYLDSVMVNNLRKVPSMGFQVKFPSLANLQLIRSLILTTLLTALFSLFCKNLYYSIRKWAYGRRKKNWIPIGVARTISVKTKNEVRHGQRVFKRLLYTLIVCFMISIAVITLIVCINTSILLPEFEYEHLYFIPIIYVFISALLIYYGYKKVRYPLLKAQYGNDESDMQETEKQPFTIFIHERDEAAEYDRLVQEQLNESQEKKIVQSSEEDANE